MSSLRRLFCLSGLLAMLGTPALAADDKAIVEVWKSPTCGCCKVWVAHLIKGGFSVKVNDTGNDRARTQLGMPTKFGACHTARVGGYVIEGHVPVADIIRLLKSKPDALGIAVPGMPIGSPGMDGPAYRGRQDPYDVLLVERDGTARIFQSHR